MKLVALQALFYGGPKQPGEEFEASDQDSRILCAPDLPGGQKCRVADDKPVAVAKAPPAPPVQQPLLPAEKDDKDESLFGGKAITTESGLVADSVTKRRYKRRDMVSED
jgi:hypothetical protein